MSVDNTPQTEAHLNFLESYVHKKRIVRLFRSLIFILFFTVWEAFTRFEVIDSFLFSSPTLIMECIIEMSSDGSLFYHLGITILETIISFSLIICLGLLIAIALWWNDMLARISEPYLVILNSLPKSALAPLFIIWLGANMKTIIVASVSVALFGCILTLYSSFIETSEEKIKLIRTLGGKKHDILFKLVLPSSLPAIISAMKVNIGLSLVGVMIAEFIAAEAGLGYLIIYGTQVYKLTYVLMSIVLLCIISTGLYRILTYVERKLVQSRLP